jgi:hypothetical protein
MKSICEVSSEDCYSQIIPGDAPVILPEDEYFGKETRSNYDECQANWNQITPVSIIWSAFYCALWL